MTISINMNMIIGICIAFVVAIIVAIICVKKMRKKQVDSLGELQAYSCGSGGGMLGGGKSEKVQIYDEKYAIISKSYSESWGDSGTVTEYLVSRDIFKKLDRIIKANDMQSWHKKKFTDIFVHDGESTSYSFDYKGTSISFSSQIYPAPYGEKLHLLSEAIKEAVNSGTKLPGLKKTEVPVERFMMLQHPSNGEDYMEVETYGLGRLGFRILNGTKEEHVIVNQCRIIKLDTNTELANTINPERRYEETVYPGYVYHGTCNVKLFLEPGRYRLEIDKYSCEFDIE